MNFSLQSPGNFAIIKVLLSKTNKSRFCVFLQTRLKGWLKANLPKEIMLVTLTSDFGLEDHFVGVMKGVILTKAPHTTIVDITHNIPPQNVKKACLVLKEAAFYFPKNTLHVVVVDPTVGSNRKIIYLQTREQRFLAPDNGVLSFIAQNSIEALYEIRRHDANSIMSNTFHGRDIFAPIAGQLLQNTSPQKLGVMLDPRAIKRLSLPLPKRYENRIKGEVIDIDRFGNLITNISQSTISSDAKNIRVHMQNIQLSNVYRHYSEVEEGKLLALFNSSGFLEIACNSSNAAKKFSVSEGDFVDCSWQKS